MLLVDFQVGTQVDVRVPVVQYDGGIQNLLICEGSFAEILLDVFSRSCQIDSVAAAIGVPGCFLRCFQRGFSSTRVPLASGSGSLLLATSISSKAGFCDSFAVYLWRG